jgi:hypothetical protein
MSHKVNATTIFLFVSLVFSTTSKLFMATRGPVEASEDVGTAEL